MASKGWGEEVGVQEGVTPSAIGERLIHHGGRREGWVDSAACAGCQRLHTDQHGCTVSPSTVSFFGTGGWPDGRYPFRPLAVTLPSGLCCSSFSSSRPPSRFSPSSYCTVLAFGHWLPLLASNQHLRLNISFHITNNQAKKQTVKLG